MVAGFIAAPVLQSFSVGAALPTSSFALVAASLLGMLVIADRRAIQAVQPARSMEVLWAPVARKFRAR
jgi:hypothetical protein